MSSPPSEEEEGGERMEGYRTVELPDPDATAPFECSFDDFARDRSASADADADASDASFVPHAEFALATNDPDDPDDQEMLTRNALSLLRALIPAWTSNGWDDVLDVTLTPMTGGVTNALWLASPLQGEEYYTEKLPGYREPHATHAPVVLRVFGDATARFLEPFPRTTEHEALEEITAAGFGAKCLGTFVNGRAEAYLPNVRPLTPREMADPIVAAAIAREVARFHRVKCAARGFDPEREEEKAGGGGGGGGAAGTSEKTSSGSALFARIRSWLENAISWKFETEEADVEIALANDKTRVAMRLEELKVEIDELERECAAANSREALCHSDLLCGNFLVPESWNASGAAVITSPPPSMTLIDFEYVLPAPRGFDLANHFCEHAGFECDWAALPDADFKRSFCAAYLYGAKGEDLSGGGHDAGPDAVESLVREADAFTAVSHLHWGLWGVMQATSSTRNKAFDYVAYARKRIDAFRASRATARSNAKELRFGDGARAGDFKDRTGDFVALRKAAKAKAAAAAAAAAKEGGGE